jgi:hypothetical protein
MLWSSFEFVFLGGIPWVYERKEFWALIDPGIVEIPSSVINVRLIYMASYIIPNAICHSLVQSAQTPFTSCNKSK